MLKHSTLLVTGLIASVNASPAHARQDRQLWTGASASVKLNDKWQLNQEVQTRFSDKRNGLFQVQAVTLLGYKINRSLTVAGGYVHSPLYTEGEFQVVERRARQQITVDNVAQFAGGKVSARMRVEQRWRDNVEGTAVRMRPYVKFSRPLKSGSKTSLNLASEAYVNLNTASFQRTEGFDRMRNAVSLNTKLSPKLSLEAGYLNQYGFVRNRDDTIDHVATVNLGLSL